MAMTLLPRWYFFGLIAGLVSLSILGTQLRPHKFAEGFVRYHQHIGSETGFLPTPREIETILDARMAGDPIFVIVGGSSILHGVGQQPDQLWSRELQNQLGDRYRVINFALRAGRAHECGAVAAEMLLQRGLPVIYVADGVGPADLQQPGFYSRCVHHAWIRGHLLPWPPREQVMHVNWLRSRELLQHDISGLLDGVLNFENVWHYVSFEHVSPVWSALLREESFEPKSFVPDQERSLDFYREYRLKRPRFDAELITARRAADGSLAEQSRPSSAGNVETAFPAALRAVMITVLTHYDPTIVSLLSPEQQAAMARRNDLRATRLREIGVADVVISSQFTEDDYADLLHLLPSGGQKLAKEVAPSVRNLARKLGYTP